MQARKGKNLLTLSFSQKLEIGEESGGAQQAELPRRWGWPSTGLRGCSWSQFLVWVWLLRLAGCLGTRLALQAGLGRRDGQ